MSKIYGLFGAMTGKVADVVMVVRNGEQIVRKYQPVIYNPSTPAQIATRARLKLMSQLAAVMSPVIALRREGNVSSRNKFVSLNYGTSSYSNNQAQINLPAVKLTDGVVALPPISVSREGGQLSASLSSVYENVDRMVYVSFVKQADGTLRYQQSLVVSEAGAGNVWTGVFGNSTASIIYAYGIRFNTTAARVAFGNMRVETADDIARLIVTSVLSMSDITLTETQASVVPAA